MQLYFSELFFEFHGVRERPLMSFDLSEGSTHEDGSYFIGDGYFGNVIRECPQDCEFLSSSVPIELGDTLRVTDCHDIKNAVKGSSQALIIFIADLKQL